MARVYTGTVTVNNNLVTGWVGDDSVVLSELTAPAGSHIIIDGYSNYIKERTSTNTLTLETNHGGSNGTNKRAVISAMTAQETQIGVLNARTVKVLEELSALDANGRGLFYNLIGVTGVNDPGPGKIAFNNINPTSVTEAYLDVLDANTDGRDVSGIMDLWDAGTVLIFRSIASTAYYAYVVTAPLTVESGYYRAALAYVSHDGMLAAEPLAVEWRLSGSDRDVDATVNSLADLATYGDEAKGFRVMVADIGGGIAARFDKLSADNGDWSSPSRFTGPVVSIGAGTTTTLTPDSDATVSVTPVSGGYVINIGVPRGVDGEDGPEGPEGPEGPQGNGLDVDAFGTLAQRPTYNAQPEGFAFFDTDGGDIYFRAGSSGNWVGPYPFQGPAGADGEDGVDGIDGEDGAPGLSGAVITTSNGVGDGTVGPYNLVAPPFATSATWAYISGVYQQDFTVTGNTITFAQAVPVGLAWQVKASGPLPVGFASSIDVDTVGADQVRLAEIVAIRTKLNALAKPTTAVQGNLAVFGSTREVSDTGISKATQAVAEAGTNDVSYMTALKTAQAIAKLSPPTDVSALMLALADLQGSRLAMKGGIADPFDDETGVNLGTPRGIDDFTKLLLKGDGTNGSTFINDSSYFLNTVTNVNATVSTAQSKFGGSSLSFNGTNAYLTALSPDYGFATSEDLTLECWVRFNVVPTATFSLMDFRASGGNNIVLATNGGRISAYIASAWRFTTGPVCVADTWYHVALVRSASVFTLYVDGVAYGTYTNNLAIPTPTGLGLVFGAFNTGASSFLNGYMDEVRISKGIARWTADFTPPTVAYALPLGGSLYQEYDTALDLFKTRKMLRTAKAYSSLAAANFVGAYTLVNVITASALDNTGSGGVIINFSNSGGAGVFNGMMAYIGHKAAAGDLVDFESTPTPITFSGATSINLAAGAEISSDLIPFVVQPGKDLLIAMQGTGTGTLARFTLPSTGTAVLYKTGLEAATVDKTGYTDYSATARSMLVSSIVLPEPNINLTVVSVPVTATAVPTSGRVSLQLDTPLTVVPNTDFTVEMSRDGGTTWSAGVLALSATLGTVKTYDAIDINLSGQPSGTSMVWRYKTLTNKNIPVSGYVMQWK